MPILIPSFSRSLLCYTIGPIFALSCFLSSCASDRTQSKTLVTPTITEDRDVFDGKVAVVDLLEVVRRSNIGRITRDKHQQEIERLRNVVRDEKDKLDQLKIRFDSNNVGWTEYAEQRTRHQVVTRQLQELEQKSGRTIYSKPELTVIPTVLQVVERIAEREGLLIVIDKGKRETIWTTIYLRQPLDLTERVLLEVNRLSP